MAIQERKEREKEELRQKIFEAASQIILVDGYEKLSMRRIAEKIEYSPTILYHYFSDKADIVTQITLEVYRNCVGSVKKELGKAADLDAQTQLRVGLKALIRSFVEKASFFRAILLSGGSMTVKDLNTSSESGFDILNGILQKGLKEKTFKSVTPITLEVLIAAVFGLAFHIINNSIVDFDKIDAMAETLAQTLLAGLCT